MSAIVVEERIASSAVGAASVDLVIVPRPRRRGHWQPLDADVVVTILSAAGREAIVMARAAAADPDAASLPALGRVMGTPVIRLPDSESAAEWAIAVASHPDFDGHDRHHRLEVLVGAAASGRPAPALRPGVLARWATRSWRPCGRCAGGGLMGCPCGRCGVPVRGAAA